MLKLSNETKIGIFAVAAIALGVWGFKFLKGINILTTSQSFYVRYTHVDQLRPSSPIFLNGLQVGVVKSLYQDPEDGTKIIAVLNVDRGVMVPKNSQAVIVGQSLMGGKALRLDFTIPCSGPDCAQNGDWLEGRVLGFLESMVGDPSNIDAYTQRLMVAFDTLTDPANPRGLGKTLVGLETTLTNLAIMSAKVNRMLDASSAGITATVNNAADITRTLRESNRSITGALANIDSLTTQLKMARMDKSVAKAGIALDSMTATLSTLRTALAGAGQSIAKVDTLAQKFYSGGGTFEQLLTDPTLYTNLVRNTHHLHLLLQDLRLNPKRYTTVKLKVFGKNKTKSYIAPLEDPAYKMLIDSLENEYERKMKN